jgi:hypothetical protein
MGRVVLQDSHERRSISDVISETGFAEYGLRQRYV